MKCLKLFLYFYAVQLFEAFSKANLVTKMAY